MGGAGVIRRLPFCMTYQAKLRITVSKVRFVTGAGRGLGVDIPDRRQLLAESRLSACGQLILKADDQVASS